MCNEIVFVSVVRAVSASTRLTNKLTGSWLGSCSSCLEVRVGTPYTTPPSASGQVPACHIYTYYKAMAVIIVLD